MRLFISSRRTPSARRTVSTVTALVCGAGVLAGCTTDQLSEGLAKVRAKEEGAVASEKPDPTLPSKSANESAVPGGSGAGLTDGQVPKAWQQAVTDVESQFGGSVGIAIAAPGGEVAEFGSLLSDVAWSTSKVPVAVAVVREQGVTPNVTSAITVSDNAAAEAMWASLGDAATAGQKVNQVLRDGGDTATQIQTERVRPEFTAFGQTQWALKDQATFGANLRCMSGGTEVASLMEQISAGQNYGLGGIEGAAFKGGWGPDLSGSYLTRQFGVLPGAEPGKFFGVAIAVKSADGTYETEQAMLTAIASTIREHPVPGGAC